ncbi:MAG: General transcription factor IIH subunit 4, variant 2 [Marteilia pararefringens]
MIASNSFDAAALPSSSDSLAIRTELDQRNNEAHFWHIARLIDQIDSLCPPPKSRSSLMSDDDEEDDLQSDMIMMTSGGSSSNSTLLQDSSIFLAFIWPYLDVEQRAALLANMMDPDFAMASNGPREKNMHDYMKKYNLLRSTNEGLYVLTKYSRELLSSVFLGSGNLDSLSSDFSDKNPKTKDQLIAYSRERWELVLNFIISQNTIDQAKKIGKDLAEVLIFSKLVKNENVLSKTFGVTSDGFRFLLMPLGQQISIFLLNYCLAIGKRDNNKISSKSALLLVSKIALLEPFGMFTTKDFSSEQIKILQNLREMGLVFQRKRSDIYFYTTDLVSLITNFIPKENLFKDIHETLRENQKFSLLSGENNDFDNKNVNNKIVDSMSKQFTVTYDDTQYIIVESNLHLYAYSTSLLKLSLISLFCEIEYQFNNMIAGLLTKESIQNAVRIGISADEVSILHSLANIFFG